MAGVDRWGRRRARGGRGRGRKPNGLAGRAFCVRTAFFEWRGPVEVFFTVMNLNAENTGAVM